MSTFITGVKLAVIGTLFNNVVVLVGVKELMFEYTSA